MNTKSLILTGLAVVVLAGVGVGGFVYVQKNKPATENSENSKKNVLTSVKDLFTKSLNLACTFTDEEGRQTTSYIKNGNVRADFTGKTPQDSGSVIVRDKKMYLWTADKKGFTMDITEAQMNGSANTPVAKGVKTPNEPKPPVNNNILANLEKYRNSCKNATIDDALFVPPTDVEFSDLSKLMKAIPTMPPVTPGTEGTPLNADQVKDLMKQFAPSGTPEQP